MFFVIFTTVLLFLRPGPAIARQVDLITTFNFFPAKAGNNGAKPSEGEANGRHELDEAAADL